MTMMNRELDVFVRSNLHGADWPKETCGVVFNSTQLFGTAIVSYNEQSDRHCEVILMDHLRSQLSDQRPNIRQRAMPLKIFLSYSPCSECSHFILRCLRQTQEELRLHLPLVIVFSGFYMINRPSCADWGCRHGEADSSIHEENRLGLLELMDNDVRLRPFLRDDWYQLASTLVPDNGFVAAGLARRALHLREVEDRYVWDDFNRLFQQVRRGAVGTGE